jgi:hypothetical protein
MPELSVVTYVTHLEWIQNLNLEGYKFYRTISQVKIPVVVRLPHTLVKR